MTKRRDHIVEISWAYGSFTFPAMGDKTVYIDTKVSLIMRFLHIYHETLHQLIYKIFKKTRWRRYSDACLEVSKNPFMNSQERESNRFWVLGLIYDLSIYEREKWYRQNL